MIQLSILVRHAMTESPKTAAPDMNAADAAALMKQFDTGAIPVAREGDLQGIVTDRDIALRVVAERRDPNGVKLEEIMTRSPVTVSPDTRVSEARDLMAEHRIRRLPVEKNGELVGIISMGDIAFADASKRAVGEALDEISESPETHELKDVPERGTPQTVRDNREPRA